MKSSNSYKFFYLCFSKYWENNNQQNIYKNVDNIYYITIIRPFIIEQLHLDKKVLDILGPYTSVGAIENIL